MYMGNMTEPKFLLSTVKASNRTRDAAKESYAKSYECAIHVMDELEMEKRCHTGIPTSFSSFLSRNKELGKYSDSDPGIKRLYVSPSPVSGTPRVTFTQPRRQDRERADSGAGCFRKLHFEKAAEVKSEMSVIPTIESQSLSRVITDVGNKKSWADMVEEDEQNMLSDNKYSKDKYISENDEQILLESRSCYGDENEDCNVMNRKFNSLGVRDGYQSQPGTATCRRSQMVKRSLTFDRSENINEDENYSYVPKENMGYESSD